MSSRHQRFTSVMRLAAIAATTASLEAHSLEAQFSELERLREQVRKAQLQA